MKGQPLLFYIKKKLNFTIFVNNFVDIYSIFAAWGALENISIPS